MTYAEVVISERGGGNPRRLAIAAPQASWELSNAGSFSGFARFRDLREAGLGRDLKGKWLEWEHPTAGRWGGVITGRPTTDDVAEIAAEGWASLIRGRVITTPVRSGSTSAGALARRAVMLAGQEEATYIAIGSVDEGGPHIALDLSGDVGADILGQIAEAGDIEWRIDADRVFHCARRLGRDRSAWVHLLEDRHIVDSRTDDDLWSSLQGQIFIVQSELSLAQQTLPTPTTPPLPPAPQPAPPTPALHPPGWFLQGIVGESTMTGSGDLPEGVPVGMTSAVAAPSAVSPGLLQFYQTAVPSQVQILNSTPPPPPWSGQAPGIGANNPAIPGQPRVPLPTSPMTVTVRDVDQNWATWDIGDTIRVALGSIGFMGRLRIIVKAIDAASGTMTVSGEALGDG